MRVEQKTVTGKNIPGRGNSMDKVRKWLVWLRKCKYLALTGMEDMSWGVVGNEARVFHRPMKWLVWYPTKLEFLFQN